MKILDGQRAVYADWKAVNADSGYSTSILKYAEAWADLMEEAMRVGMKLEDIAEQTSRTADTGGITGFMYGAAVSTLAQCWEHGKALQRWHNLDIQIGSEGEAANRDGKTLNPALLNMAVKKGD